MRENIKQAKCEICRRKVEPDMNICTQCFDEFYDDWPEVWGAMEAQGEVVHPRRRCHHTRALSNGAASEPK